MMDALNIFLEALEHRLGFKDKFFISKSDTVANDKFPAYKTYKLEVWCVDGTTYNECISTATITQRVVNPEEKSDIERKLLRATFENLLNFYGI